MKEQIPDRNFDYEAVMQKFKEQFRSGKSLFGKDGAFGPMLQDFLNAALESESDSFMDEDGRPKGNRKNGYNRKSLRTADGTIEIATPRDRDGEFEPQIVKKRETILAESLEHKIIGMYGLGVSFRDISQHLKEMYDTDISAATLSAITDKVIPLVKEWQNRPLEDVYCIVWMDAMFYKVKDEGRHVTRCIYNLLGINKEGRKEVLGCYVSESEGANFWLSVLTDLHSRGVKDILIACIDNLNGFQQAIQGVFPATEVQSCIVHQIRNSLNYVASKDQKAFMKELKPVYQAVNKDMAEENFSRLAETWKKKYPVVIGSWEKNWEKLTAYFKYPDAIRKLIYTTNTIEGYHRQIRKITKTKGAFTSDMALLKLVYLASRNIEKKWTQPLQNWSLTVSQLSIIFGERLTLKI
ncbi:MAG TPA: IS256 family transposase [Saprospirales bacterium]|nr:IS256 family transposase [Saprospirales bacterium]